MRVPLKEMPANLTKNILGGYGPALLLMALGIVYTSFPVWALVLAAWILGALLTLAVAYLRSYPSKPPVEHADETDMESLERAESHRT